MQKWSSEKRITEWRKYDNISPEPEQIKAENASLVIQNDI